MYYSIKQVNQKRAGQLKSTFLQRRHTDGHQAHEKRVYLHWSLKKYNSNHNEITMWKEPISKGSDTSVGEGAE